MAAVTELYQIAGTYVALPDYARTDLAFVAVIQRPDPGAGATLTYRSQGQYIEILLTCRFDYTADATVTTRTPFIQVNGVTVGAEWSVPAPGQIGQSGVGHMTFSVNTPFAYVTGQFQVVGVPVSTMSNGDFLTIAASAQQGGDTITNTVLTLVRIPTGPRLASVAAAPVAVPLLV